MPVRLLWVVGSGKLTGPLKRLAALFVDNGQKVDAIGLDQFRERVINELALITLEQREDALQSEVIARNGDFLLEVVDGLVRIFPFHRSLAAS